MDKNDLLIIKQALNMLNTMVENGLGHSRESRGLLNRSLDVVKDELEKEEVTS